MALNAQLVRDFYAHMTQRFGARVVPKGSALEMKLAAEFLELGRLFGMELPDRESFASYYVTTFGSTIYTPFKPGEPMDVWDLWSQIEVLAHECEHVDQKRRRAHGAHELDYLTSTPKRAHIEAEAYRVNMELMVWRYGRLNADAPHLLARKLKDYGCSVEDVLFVERHLRSSMTSVSNGAVISVAAYEALRWLEQRAPELRASDAPTRLRP